MNFESFVEKSKFKSFFPKDTNFTDNYKSEQKYCIDSFLGYQNNSNSIVDSDKVMNEEIVVREQSSKKLMINQFKLWKEQRSDEQDVHEYLLSLLKILNQNEPTPVQKISMAVFDNRYDQIACAQTGTGKTMAQCLPIVNRLIKNNNSTQDDDKSYPAVLVLSPTRELSLQTYYQFIQMTYGTGLKCANIVGGVSINEQMEQFKNGIDIVIGTPGRIIDFMDRGHLDFSNCKITVVDEADKMLDMGFEPQLTNILLKSSLKHDTTQIIMTSATFSEPIQAQATKQLKEPLVIEVGNVGSSPDQIDQQFIQVPENQQLIEITRLMEEWKDFRILIFCETKEDVKKLNKIFWDEQNIPVASLHGDKKQKDRFKACDQFKNGTVSTLIATDVASRGLDFPVDLVINFEMPKNIDTQVHRIGRTGRIGKKGVSVTFLTREDEDMIRQLYGWFKDDIKKPIPNEIDTFLQSLDFK